MKIITRSAFYFLCFSLLFSPVRAAAQSFADAAIDEKIRKVSSIEVRGNKTISIATVLSKIKTRVGQDYQQAVVSDDLKRLYITGYFSDVRVDRELVGDGFNVIIFIEEKSVIEEITFSKTRHIKKKELVKKLKSASW